jgi:Mce-associated membrane protein
VNGTDISREKGTPDVVSQPKQGPGNLVLALAAALVVALGACVWLAVSAGGSGDEESLRERVSVLEAEKAANQEAIEAASAFVARVTTYSFEEGQHDLDWVDDLQNEEVREQFRERVADLQRTIVASKTSAKGEVTQSAGRVVDDSRVEVLAFVDQAITDQSGEVSVEQSSINLTMTLVGGEWKVDTLTFLNAVNP